MKGFFLEIEAAVDYIKKKLERMLEDDEEVG